MGKISVFNFSGLENEVDVQAIHQLISDLRPHSTVVDFAEQIQLEGVRLSLRIWRLDGRVVGFAYLDDYNNLWFDADSRTAGLAELEKQQVEWGIIFQRQRTSGGGINATLDSTCDVRNNRRVQLLESSGFVRNSVTTLQYSRSFTEPIHPCCLPPGFTIRNVDGESELEALVKLHRAAFDTDQMTVELRGAMMNTSQYRSELDLVVVDPQGQLAGFCVGGIEDESGVSGYTDPIGTHPAYRKLGLGKAVVSEGLMRLRGMGVKTARLGTSSENLAMQRLAESLKFERTSEKAWFSKAV